MGETAQEVWDRVVERARKERDRMPKSNDDKEKDPYKVSRNLTFFGEMGSYVGGRKLSEAEADARYAAKSGKAAMADLEAKRAKAKRMGYDSVGEMNFYEREAKPRSSSVQDIANRYVSGKNRGTAEGGDIALDPSVKQYYQDKNGTDRVMLLPKMQYQTNVNQQRIANEMADRSFQAQQAQLQWENERRLEEWEAAQKQQEFSNQMSQRQFGLQEGQLTGRYRSQDVSNLLNQLGALKQQGSIAGKSADYYSNLRVQGDAIRNQLAAQGYDTSNLGSNVSLQDFYKNAGQAYIPTMNARELEQRGSQFDREHAFRQQQSGVENQFRQQQLAYQREQDGIANALRQGQFNRGAYESDRDYELKLSQIEGTGQVDMRSETAGLRNHLNTSQAALEKALVDRGLSPDSNDFRLALYKGREDIATRSARQITEDLNAGYYTREQAEALLNMVNSNLGTKVQLGK